MSIFIRWRLAALTLPLLFPPLAARGADAAAPALQPLSPALPEALPSPHAPAPATLRLGAYYAALTHRPLWPPTSCNSLLVCPWRVSLEPDYLASAHLAYTLWRFDALPLDIELEGGVAKRFGKSNEAELYLLPMARWKAFPWNDYVYTNFRVGLLGPSFVTGVSAWERENSGNQRKGSRLLNFLVLEAAFAPDAQSPVEVFVRLHHRSGIFGLIDGVHGGSNYIGAGIRYSLF